MRYFDSHLMRQTQIHHVRHVVLELGVIAHDLDAATR